MPWQGCQMSFRKRCHSATFCLDIWIYIYIIYSHTHTCIYIYILIIYIYLCLFIFIFIYFFHPLGILWEMFHIGSFFNRFQTFCLGRWSEPRYSSTCLGSEGSEGHDCPWQWTTPTHPPTHPMCMCVCARFSQHLMYLWRGKSPCSTPIWKLNWQVARCLRAEQVSVGRDLQQEERMRELLRHVSGRRGNLTAQAKRAPFTPPGIIEADQTMAFIGPCDGTGSTGRYRHHDSSVWHVISPC